MDYTNITLGELLSSTNETIKRNAVSILKQLQARKLQVKSESVETKFEVEKRYCTWCGYVEAQTEKNCIKCGRELHYKI